MNSSSSATLSGGVVDAVDPCVREDHDHDRCVIGQAAGGGPAPGRVVELEPDHREELLGGQRREQLRRRRTPPLGEDDSGVSEPCDLTRAWVDWMLLDQMAVGETEDPAECLEGSTGAGSSTNRPCREPSMVTMKSYDMRRPFWFPTPHDAAAPWPRSHVPGERVGATGRSSPRGPSSSSGHTVSAASPNGPRPRRVALHPVDVVTDRAIRTTHHNRPTDARATPTRPTCGSRSSLPARA